MKPEKIIIHCSATKDSGTVSWGAIRKYHMQTLGWKNIGYHFGIELVNDQYEILLGRWWDEQGAHCAAQQGNINSLGICLVGDFSNQPPPKEQWDKAIQLVRRLCVEFQIRVADVKGHCELDPGKTCPQFDMGKFRSAVIMGR